MFDLERRMVHICAKCGRGFPPWSDCLSMRIDDLPLWATTEVYEDLCRGGILELDEQSQIERCNLEEFFSGEQWTERKAEAMRSARDRPPIKQDQK